MKKILLLLLVLIAGFLTFVISRPDAFHVERSTTIAASPEIVFARINDLHAWSDWSPWEKLDPAMKRTYDGPESGPGAAYSWAGNDKVGKGKMSITDAARPTHVGIRLEFLEPFQATNQAAFALVPEGAGTKVTWSMDGRNNFVAKVFSVFMNMDQTVGGDFEKGLANLKETAVQDARRKAAADSAQAATDAAGAK